MRELAADTAELFRVDTNGFVVARSVAARSPAAFEVKVVGTTVDAPKYDLRPKIAMSFCPIVRGLH